MKPKNKTVTCVYWDDTGVDKHWTESGCTAILRSENFTKCSCTHLSTFALILQLHDENQVDNTSHLNLCISLFVAHLLFLTGADKTQNKILCSAIAVALHFFFLASFVWMFLEAVQLFMLMKRLKKVMVLRKQGLACGYLLLIGYFVPAIIVSVSASLCFSGYGNENVLTEMEMSTVKDTRMLILKSCFQFVILGCSWILGFIPEEIFSVLFVVINSQQGTFIFIVYCLFNMQLAKLFWTLAQFEGIEKISQCGTHCP
ncbi:hypothetical protein Z043_117016, partial [Scleropages formosus]